MKTFPPPTLAGRHADGRPDISTTRGRSLAFNERVEALMLPTPKGGQGLTFNAAIEKMQETPEDRALIEAMGYQRKTFWNSAPVPPPDREFDKLDPVNLPKKDSVKGAIALHLWKPKERQKAFDSKMNELTRAKDQGGQGMNTKDAIAWMRSDPDYRELLRHMGDAVSQDDKKEFKGRSPIGTPHTLSTRPS
jgi:hypothetical protein